MLKSSTALDCDNYAVLKRNDIADGGWELTAKQCLRDTHRPVGEYLLKTDRKESQHERKVRTRNTMKVKGKQEMNTRKKKQREEGRKEVMTL